MEYCVKIPLNEHLKYQNFEWNSRKYKNLKAVFCSPDVQLSMLFKDGKKLFMRGFDYRKSKGIAPNNRVFYIDKKLDNELVTGVLQKEIIDLKTSIYLIVEK